MPKVRLLGGSLRKWIGAKEIELPGETLAELLDAFVERGGAEIAQRVFDSGSEDADHVSSTLGRADGRALDRDLRLLVNGRNALFLRGLDTRLDASDVVTVHFAGSRAFPGG